MSIMPKVFFILLRSIDRVYKHSANRAAIVQYVFNFIIGYDAGLIGNLYPILGFITFFQCDLQLCDEIGATVSIFSFTNIRADTCTASFKLIG